MRTRGRHYLSQNTQPQILIKNKADFIAAQEAAGVPGFSRQTLPALDVQKIQEVIATDLQNAQADPAMLMAAAKVKEAEDKKAMQKKLLIGGGVLIAIVGIYLATRKKKPTRKRRRK